MRLAPLVLLPLLLLLPAQAALAAPKPKPNLLVIMTDDQRADGTLSVMPATRRKIARQGKTFLEAHTTTPKCCPSRASFFTGLYPHNHRVTSNLKTDQLDHRLTVQRLVRRRGYRTAIFGKFLNGWPIEVAPPFFDEWAIINAGYRRSYWNIDGRVRRKRRYSTDLIADRAVRFVRRAEREDERPWLAWVTPYAPHLPSIPAPRHRNAPLRHSGASPAMTEGDWSDKPDFLDRARDFPHWIDTMREDGPRSLMAVDDLVRRLLEELRLRREHKNTLVVFTSDNGFLLGEHGGLAGKDLPYRASTRIPLLVRWPGRIRRGRTSAAPVTNLDVATTVLEAAGVRRLTDGRSLLSRRPHEMLFMEHGGGRKSEPDSLPLPAWRSLLGPDYRYAEYFDGRQVIGSEYYDHAVDPWELDNRVEEIDPAQIAALSATMEEFASCGGRACP